MTTETLDFRVAKLLECKTQEELHKQERIYWEEQVAQLVPGPDSGSKTITLEDGTKITVKRGYNYKAACDSIRSLMQTEYPEESLPLKSKTTVELDEKGYEYYRVHHKELFNALSHFVTVVPKKVAVEIKRKC